MSRDMAEELPGETEQRTPKAGYLLLFVMFVAALFFGWRAIDDLADVPEKPEFLSRCAASYIEYRWEDAGRFEYFDSAPQPYEVAPYYPAQKPVERGAGCVFSSFERSAGIPAVFEARRALDEELAGVARELEVLRPQLYQYENDYGLSLQERMIPGEPGIYSSAELQKRIGELKPRVVSLEERGREIRSALEPYDRELQAKYGALLPEYRNLWRWYEFKLFLLEIVFVFPFFALVFWWYRRLLERKSPYTIIFTALLAVAAVLSLRVLVVWFWSMFLARLIESLWEFVQNFALLKSLVFYGGMILSIALFGGAVYVLQKRIFDPKRVAARRLGRNQCPECETTLDLAGAFCPKCGRRVREACPKCGAERFTDIAYCPRCGAARL